MRRADTPAGQITEMSASQPSPPETIGGKGLTISDISQTVWPERAPADMQMFLENRSSFAQPCAGGGAERANETSPTLL
ncbi:hypothetical protein MJO29_013838 [Puccinia striiformis f. sp. tritici]|nr:hypothetical protein MJO29_013838 [Puccinia striiformis f. sp. tritici]